MKYQLTSIEIDTDTQAAILPKGWTAPVCLLTLTYQSSNKAVNINVKPWFIITVNSVITHRNQHK